MSRARNRVTRKDSSSKVAMGLPRGPERADRIVVQIRGSGQLAESNNNSDHGNKQIMQVWRGFDGPDDGLAGCQSVRWPGFQVGCDQRYDVGSGVTNDHSDIVW